MSGLTATNAAKRSNKITRQDPLLQSKCHYLLSIQQSKHYDKDKILIEIVQMSQIASCVNIIDYNL